MASWGSTPLFHLVGLTPEAQTLMDVGGDTLSAKRVTRADLDGLRSTFGAKGDPVDVVVFAAPQLSIFEMQTLAGMLVAQTAKIPIIVCTSPQVYGDATRMGFVATIERAGAKVLEGTCYYNQYAREIGKANGWSRLLSNSVKIVNILGGYGYQPALATMEDCVASAIAGKVVA